MHLSEYERREIARLEQQLAAEDGHPATTGYPADGADRRARISTLIDWIIIVSLAALASVVAIFAILSQLLIPLLIVMAGGWFLHGLAPSPDRATGITNTFFNRKNNSGN